MFSALTSVKDNAQDATRCPDNTGAKIQVNRMLVSMYVEIAESVEKSAAKAQYVYHSVISLAQYGLAWSRHTGAAISL
jgi:hypothetical protein